MMLLERARVSDLREDLHVEPDFKIVTKSSTKWEPDFVKFYEDNFVASVKIAYLIVQSHQLAEDIVQDSFFKVHKRWSKIDSPSSYLRKAVVNSCNSYFKHKKIERIVAPKLARRESIQIDDDDGMQDSIRQLPYKQQVAVILRYYEDLPDVEIAKALGCQVGTVAGLISRALDQLRGKVVNDGL
ncbi:MAG: SigE family RNA polymerase sigma factor [Acidimicrobiales bacterium]|nr:SigE family RNA polymerase sigma factor [Acidimicrobiales bacterium]